MDNCAVRLRTILPGHDGWVPGIPGPDQRESESPPVEAVFPWTHVPKHVRLGQEFHPFGNISPGVGNPVTIKRKEFILLSYLGSSRLCILPQSPGKGSSRLSWSKSPLPPEWDFSDQEVTRSLFHSNERFTTYETQTDTAVPGGTHGFHFLMGVVSMSPKKKFPLTWALLKKDWGGKISTALEAYQNVETFRDRCRVPRRRTTPRIDSGALTGSLGVAVGESEGAHEARILWGSLGLLHETSMGELLPFTNSTNPTKSERAKRYRLGEGTCASECLQLKIPLQQWEQFYNSVKVGQFCAFPYPTLGHVAFQHGDYTNACTGVRILSSGSSEAREPGVLDKIGGCYAGLALSHTLTAHQQLAPTASWPAEVAQLPQRWWDCLTTINKRMPTPSADAWVPSERLGNKTNGLALSKIGGIPTLVVVQKILGLSNPPSYKHFWLWPGVHHRDHGTWSVTWEGSNALPLRLPVAPIETQRRVAE